MTFWDVLYRMVNVKQIAPSFMIQKFHKRLASWYIQNARKLPWRKNRDPYRVWISEIMLQQTQVKTVIPYYERWMKRFPDLASLSKSSLDDVLHHWAGLGYYRRAKMLHEAAKKICREGRGLFPKTVDELMKIPGIGRYTAGAIASIAFEQKVPILDGNIIRVLARLYVIKEDVAQPSTLKKLWALSESLLPNQQIGDFNQAMMELGAMICTPSEPQCPICPVQKLCSAFKLGIVDSLPVKKKDAPAIKTHSYALIVTDQEKVLIEKQSKERRWRGLWMFPHWQEKTKMCEDTGLAAAQLKARIKIDHCFTKYRITLNVFEPPARCTVSSSFTSRRDLKWVKISKLSEYAFPSPHKKIANSLASAS